MAVELANQAYLEENGVEILGTTYQQLRKPKIVNIP